MNQQARLEQALEDLINECCTETTGLHDDWQTFAMIPPSLEAIGEARHVLESVRRERKREEADLADRFYRKHYGPWEDPSVSTGPTPLGRFLEFLEELGRKQGRKGE